MCISFVLGQNDKTPSQEGAGYNDIVSRYENSIPSRDGNGVVVKARNNLSIATLGSFKPFGNARDGR